MGSERDRDSVSGQGERDRDTAAGQRERDRSPEKCRDSEIGGRGTGDRGRGLPRRMLGERGARWRPRVALSAPATCSSPQASSARPTVM